MRHFPTIRTAALLSVAAAALSLGACNRNGSAQNGAYVSGSPPSAAPVASSAPLPPANTYQRVADTPPPPLPVYDQPPMPGPGYIWTPGYWDWGDDDSDYYWVPGTWVEPPEPGYLWTPGYWRFYDGRYLYSDGYWGPEVGFYGGVDYGYGYGGDGYDGGRWQGNQFYYNTQVNNFGGRRVENTYSQGVNAGTSRVAFNGGPGGLRVAPAAAEIAAAQAHHVAPTHVQIAAVHAARAQPQLRASVNGGAPPIAATSRPSAFRGAGVTASRSAGSYTPPPGHGAGAQPAAGGLAASLPGARHETQLSPSAPLAGRPSEVGRTPAIEHPVAAAPPAALHERGVTHAGPPAFAGPAHEAQIRAAPIHEPQARAAPPMRAAPEMRTPAAIHAAPEMRAAPAIRAAPEMRAAPAHAPPAAAPRPAAAPHPAAAPKAPGEPDRK